LQHLFGDAVTASHVLVAVAPVFELGPANAALFKSKTMDLAVVAFGLVQVAVGL